MAGRRPAQAGCAVAEPDLVTSHLPDALDGDPYCTVCGSPRLVERYLGHRRCEACGTTRWRNPLPVAEEKLFDDQSVYQKPA